jgi:hypothetical protein
LRVSETSSLMMFSTWAWSSSGRCTSEMRLRIFSLEAGMARPATMVGRAKKVSLEVLVAAVEGLVEVLLRLDLLREHLGAGAAQGPGDLVAPEGGRLGEVHLHDVGEIEKTMTLAVARSGSSAPKALTKPSRKRSS